MCGIAGVVALTDEHIPSPARLGAVRQVLRHRGPDEFGEVRGTCYWFGHQRLSIIDLASGKQPMVTEDEQFVISYNGEVFNHEMLAADLREQGVEYRTRCDTESILHLAAREWYEAPRKLRGMFAFAVWNSVHRTLLLARDRFGVKPLYYSLCGNGSLVFASEIKALLQFRDTAPTLNVSALPSMLANLAPMGTQTMFDGVQRLEPGHTLVWKDGKIEIRQYWTLADKGADPIQGNEKSLVREYHDRLREAVRLRLMSDVELGVFLSGGIDSSAITALASSELGAGMHSFSVAFEEADANELRWAQKVADLCRTEHHEITVTPGDFWNILPTLIWHEDEPIAHPSSVPLHFVSKLASEYVKVVLTGEGSDETLGGYNKYRVTLANIAMARMYANVVPHGLRNFVARGLSNLSSSARTAYRLKRTFLAREGSLDALYVDNFAVFSTEQIASLLKPGVLKSPIDPFKALRAAVHELPSSTPLLNQMLWADMKTYLHELLMKQDQMSMSASIESRVPFLDHPLVEWSWALPTNMKIRNGTTKYILRQAMRGILPDEILFRKKMGFPVPVGRWLRGPQKRLLTDIVDSPRLHERNLFQPSVVRDIVQRHISGEWGMEQKVWSLLNFELWARIFLDGESIEAVTGSLHHAIRAR